MSLINTIYIILFIIIICVYGYMFLCKFADIEFTYNGYRKELQNIANIKIVKINLISFKCLAYVPNLKKHFVIKFTIDEIFDLKPIIN